MSNQVKVILLKYSSCVKRTEFKRTSRQPIIRTRSLFAVGQAFRDKDTHSFNFLKIDNTKCTYYGTNYFFRISTFHNFDTREQNNYLNSTIQNKITKLKNFRN